MPHVVFYKYTHKYGCYIAVWMQFQESDKQFIEDSPDISLRNI